MLRCRLSSFHLRCCIRRCLSWVRLSHHPLRRRCRPWSLRLSHRCHPFLGMGGQGCPGVGAYVVGGKAVTGVTACAVDLAVGVVGAGRSFTREWHRSQRGPGVSACIELVDCRSYRTVVYTTERVVDVTHRCEPVAYQVQWVWCCCCPWCQSLIPAGTAWMWLWEYLGHPPPPPVVPTRRNIWSGVAPVPVQVPVEPVGHNLLLP